MSDSRTKARLPQVQAPENPDVTVSVYDPALCCPTGVCGPGVDPALMEISRDLRWLEAQDVGVERFNLAQEPDAFVKNPRITGLMQAFGDDALPAVLVNDRVHIHGRYPSRDELAAAVKDERSTAVEAADPGPATGCAPGSGCC